MTTTRLFQGDCLEIMPTLAAGSVNMVLCDLPYGTTQNKWDTVLPLDAVWREYSRLCRKTVVLTASQPFTARLILSSSFQFKYSWVWRKNNATGHLNAKRMPMKEHEDIVVFGDGPYNPQGLVPHNKTVRRGHNGGNFGKSGTENFQEWTNYPRSVLDVMSDTDKVHPTQKPVALMEYLIKTYTNPGDTVLDNCMGSGTTGVACVNTGRSFIGIEKDPGYFVIAERRIKEAQDLKENEAISSNQIADPCPASPHPHLRSPHNPNR
jgi:site-specific DNA-methyltransferase (adenine-specific)